MNAAEKVTAERAAAEKLHAEKLAKVVAENRAKAAKIVAETLAGSVFPLSSVPDSEVPTKVRICCIGGVDEESLAGATSEEKAKAIFELVGNLAKLAGDFILSIKLWGIFDCQQNFLAEKTLNATLWGTIQRGDIFVAYKKTSGGKSASRSISWEVDILDAITFAEALQNVSAEKVVEAKDRVSIF